MATELTGQLMELLRIRLEAFKVPNEITRQLRDDIVDLMTIKQTRKNGAAVMTEEASIAGDRLKSGGDPKNARPKIV